jgi:hypothetical protein
MTTDEVLAAIQALPLPSREYASLLAKRESEHDKAEKDHHALGKKLATRVRRRFARALPGLNIEVISRGYCIDWTARLPKPVRPYLKLRVGILSSAAVEVQFWPKSEAELDDWCAKQIAWLKVAP